MEISTAARSVVSPALEGQEAPLVWSSWTRLRSSFSLALVPHEPGVYAVAEEVLSDSAQLGRRRMLAVFEIGQADDVAHALDRRFATLREGIQTERCFVRYALVPDRARRAAASAALENWLAASPEVATGLAHGLTASGRQDESQLDRNEVRRPGSPPPLPSGF